MELIEAVEELVAPLVGVSVAHKRTTTSTGTEFTTFHINNQGTVLQFVAQYPVTDEKYIEEFLRKIRKEL